LVGHDSCFEHAEAVVLKLGREFGRGHVARKDREFHGVVFPSISHIGGNRVAPALKIVNAAAWRVPPANALTPTVRERELSRHGRNGAAIMPFSNYVVDPAHIEAMRSAFRKVCDVLQLDSKQGEPLSDLIVKKIVERAKAGETDSDRLCSQVLLDMAAEL
jgi:hypothetical protein